MTNKSLELEAGRLVIDAISLVPKVIFCSTLETFCASWLDLWMISKPDALFFLFLFDNLIEQK